MVYVVDGVAHAGHRPRVGDEYQREPTKFAHEGPLDLDVMDLHLYVCAACPWAHRALMVRNLSHTLSARVTVSVVSPFRNDDVGWEFLNDANAARVAEFTVLPVSRDQSPLAAESLLAVYLAAHPYYTGNITTPTLYDARANRVVSNDSFGIMRAFALTVPDELGWLYPAGAMRDVMDAAGRQMDEELCKRVYMCGLARSQTAYESSLARIGAELDRLEALLGKPPEVALPAAAAAAAGDHSGIGVAGDGRDYLLGTAAPTLLDVQLLSNVFRFDPVYFDLFKVFTRRIASYPRLSALARRIVAALGGPAALALDLPQILHHYWTTFTSANPNGVVPVSYRRDFLDGGIDDFREPDPPAPMLDDAGGQSAAAAADASGHSAAAAAGATPTIATSGGAVPVAAAAATEQDQTRAAERRAAGEFVRGVSAHRDWLGTADFPLERGRYVLFVANNCPWCHRCMMARAMYPGMEALVEACVLFYRRGGPEPAKWRFLPTDDADLKQFERDRPGLLDGVAAEDPTGNGFQYANDVYRLRDPDSKEKSVPILFDKTTGRVVSNESAGIVRMLAMASGSFDAALLPRVEALNARVYQDVNNGAYRAGFSSNQAAHDAAAATYFRAFDWLDKLLARSRTKYLLTDDAPTEADLRLFPTVFRHDPVYHSRMKLNVAMVRDYPHLNRWLRDMKAHPAVQRGSRLEHCVAGYFGRTGNGLVPFAGLDHDGERPY